MCRSGKEPFLKDRKDKSLFRRLTSAARKTILAVLLVLVAVALYLSIWGVPGWALPHIVRWLSRGDIAPEIGGARLDLTSGLVLKDVALYRRGVIGPPLVQARSITVGRHPLAFFAPDAFPIRVTIRDGSVGWSESSRVRQCDPLSSEIELPVALDIESTSVEGVLVRSLKGSLNTGPEGWSLSGLNVSVSNEQYQGVIEGNISHVRKTGEIKGHIVSRINPLALGSLFDACGISSLNEIAGLFAFASAPPLLDLDVKAEGTGVVKRYTVDGSMSLGACRFRGVDVQQADGRFVVQADNASSVVAVGPLRVMRKEGFVTGSFTVDSTNTLVTFDAESTLNPKALFQMIGILTNGVMDTWTVNGPVRISGRGRTGYTDYSKTDFICRVHGWDMGIMKIVADECAFDVRMLGRTNKLENVRARLHGGELEGEATFVMPDGPDTNGSYRIVGSMKNGDFEAFTKALDILGDQGKKSRYSASADVSGNLDDMTKNTSGSGKFQVKDGRIFTMPVFGGLSTALAKIVPGLDFIMRQSDAKADFVVKDGRICTDKVAIEGDVLSLSGDGSCGLDGSLAFDVRVQLMKEHTLVARILRTITWPISKLFELRLRGTVSDPRWYPLNFASDPGPSKPPAPPAVTEKEPQ